MNAKSKEKLRQHRAKSKMKPLRQYGAIIMDGKLNPAEFVSDAVVIKVKSDRIELFA